MIDFRFDWWFCYYKLCNETNFVLSRRRSQRLSDERKTKTENFYIYHFFYAIIIKTESIWDCMEKDFSRMKRRRWSVDGEVEGRGEKVICRIHKQTTVYRKIENDRKWEKKTIFIDVDC